MNNPFANALERFFEEKFPLSIDERNQVVLSWEEMLKITKHKEIHEKEISIDPILYLNTISSYLNQFLLKKNMKIKEKIHINFLDYPFSITIQDLNLMKTNTLIRIRGIVIFVSFIKIKIKSGDCLCKICGNKFTFNDFVVPKKCNLCLSKKLTLLENSLEIYQEQIIDVESSDRCSIIKVRLSDNLINSVYNGQLLTICGVLENSEKMEFKKKKFINAWSINNISTLAAEFISNNDAPLIQQISKMPNLFSIISNSLSPTSHIHPFIKASVLLTILSSPEFPIHLLICIPENENMRTFLHFIQEIIPQSYFSNDYYLKRDKGVGSLKNQKGITSGIFSRSNGGLLIYDNFTEFKQSQHIFLECAEGKKELVQEDYSIPTKFSSIVIGTNNQRFNNSNLEKITGLVEPVLSLFSFILVANDQLAPSYLNSIFQLTPQNSPSIQKNGHNFLDSLLHFSNLNLISSSNLRKYLIYSKQFIHPIWGNEENKKLFEISKKIEKIYGEIPRLSNKIISLVLSRARIELRDNILSSDFEDIYQLYIWFLEKSNLFIEKKITINIKNKKEIFLTFMKQFQEKTDFLGTNTLTISEIKDIFLDMSLEKRFLTVNDFIEELNNSGYILQTGSKSFRAN